MSNVDMLGVPCVVERWLGAVADQRDGAGELGGNIGRNAPAQRQGVFRICRVAKTDRRELKNAWRRRIVEHVAVDAVCVAHAALPYPILHADAVPVVNEATWMRNVVVDEKGGFDGWGPLIV